MLVGLLSGVTNKLLALNNLLQAGLKLLAISNLLVALNQAGLNQVVLNQAGLKLLVVLNLVIHRAMPPATHQAT
jgi:hypothetical protein